MGSKWPTKSIAEIAASEPRALAMGPFGSNIKTENFVPSGVPIIRGQNLNAERFNDSSFVYLTGEKADELAASNAFPGDLVFTHRGTLGQVGIIPSHGKYNRYIVSQSQMKLKCDSSIVDPLFIFYFFKSPQGQYELLSNTSTTGVPAISRPLTTLKKMRVPAPPLPEQRAIAHILGTLDDKIELNRRMNETLEAMARAIFTSWFVDFDPVRAKAEGRPTGLPEEIDALFPDSFEESELGEIPVGWEVSEIKKCCTKIQNGGTPTRNVADYWEPGAIPWLKSGEVRQTIIIKTDNMISKFGFENCSAKWLPKYSTVIALYGATAGQVALIASDMTTNQAVCGLIPKDGFRYFNYLNMERSVGLLANLARGSAQQNISKGIVETTKIVLPSKNIISSFDKMISPFFNNWVNNLNASDTLASLRDTLLPKLISGEMPIPEAEIFIEEVLG